jgi:hypothetical protein
MNRVFGSIRENHGRDGKYGRALLRIGLHHAPFYPFDPCYPWFKLFLSLKKGNHGSNG